MGLWRRSQYVNMLFQHHWLLLIKTLLLTRSEANCVLGSGVRVSSIRPYICIMYWDHFACAELMISTQNSFNSPEGNSFEVGSCNSSSLSILSCSLRCIVINPWSEMCFIFIKNWVQGIHGKRIFHECCSFATREPVRPNGFQSIERRVHLLDSRWH